MDEDNKQKKRQSFLKTVRNLPVNPKLLLGVLLAILGVYAYNFYIKSNTHIQENIGTKNQSNVTPQAQGEASQQVQSMSISLDPSKKAKINEKFNNDIQACWYYQATYITLHPYTVLWEEIEYEKFSNGIYSRNNPTGEKIINLSIRVIADEGVWKANTCINEKDNEDGKKIVKLIGEESIKHRIEAQFKKGGVYKHIADAEAKYDSALHFDDKGNISHRRVKKTDTYECTFPNSLDGKITVDHNTMCVQEYKKLEEPEIIYKKNGNINYKNELTRV